jgi:hypothetical protein
VAGCEEEQSQAPATEWEILGASVYKLDARAELVWKMGNSGRLPLFPFRGGFSGVAPEFEVRGRVLPSCRQAHPVDRRSLTDLFGHAAQILSGGGQDEFVSARRATLGLKCQVKMAGLLEHRTGRQDGLSYNNFTASPLRQLNRRFPKSHVKSHNCPESMGKHLAAT